MRVIVLQPHVKKGMAPAVILAVRKDAGDLALMAKNGQGVLRLDHKTGIDIYLASYAVVKVIETSVYQIDEGLRRSSSPARSSISKTTPGAAKSRPLELGLREPHPKSG